MFRFIRNSLILSIWAGTGFSSTYYLDNNAPGPVFDGSEANPWQTVEQAQTVLNGLSDGGSGDTVLVAAGDSAYGDWVDCAFYKDDFSDLQKESITRTDWLVIKARDIGNRPEFRQLHLYGNRDAYLEFNGLHVISRTPHRYSECIHIRNATRHVRFINLNVEAEDDSTALPDGFMIAYNSPANILVEGCEIHNLGVALPASGDTLIIRNNHIHHIASSGVKSGGTGYMLVEGNHIHDQHARIVRINLYGSMYGNFERFETITQPSTGARASVYYVRDGHLEVTPTNKVVFEFETGSVVTGDSGFGEIISVDSIKTADMSHGSGLSVRNYENYVARGNIIHDYGSTAAIFCYPTTGPYRNVLFENNLVYDAITRTFVINAIAENVVVRNNTLIGGFQAYAADGYNGSGLIFHNNLATNFTAYYDSVLTTVNEGNNIIGDITVRSPYGSRDEFNTGSSSIILEVDGYGDTWFAESLFVDYGNRDFRLRENSLAIDFGDPAHAPATDWNGYNRDASPDAGCFEYGSPSGIKKTDHKLLIDDCGLLNAPNPVSMSEFREMQQDWIVTELNGVFIGKRNRAGMYLGKNVKGQIIKIIVIE